MVNQRYSQYLFDDNYCYDQLACFHLLIIFVYDAIHFLWWLFFMLHLIISPEITVGNHGRFW